MSDRTEINRQNAARSTGPRTHEGKSVVARNAVKHGVCTVAPFIPGFEREEDWQAHQAGILQSLAPIGLLETRLAERAALILWRLERLARYEATIIRVNLEEAAEPPAPSSTANAFQPESEDTLEKVGAKLARQREHLATAKEGLKALESLPHWSDETTVTSDYAFHVFEATGNALPEGQEGPDILDDGFLHSLGFPEGEDFDEVKWTAGLVRRGVAFVAKHGKTPPDKLAQKAARNKKENRDRLTAEIKQLAVKVKDLQGKRETHVERLQARRMLLDEQAEAKVLRYEAHLNRQLFQTLHELERIQAARAGREVPLPLAVDVGVEVSASGETTVL